MVHVDFENSLFDREIKLSSKLLTVNQTIAFETITINVPRQFQDPNLCINSLNYFLFVFRLLSLLCCSVCSSSREHRERECHFWSFWLGFGWANETADARALFCAGALIGRTQNCVRET